MLFRKNSYLICLFLRRWLIGRIDNWTGTGWRSITQWNFRTVRSATISNRTNWEKAANTTSFKCQVSVLKWKIKKFSSLYENVILLSKKVFKSEVQLFWNGYLNGRIRNVGRGGIVSENTICSSWKKKSDFQ